MIKKAAKKETMDTKGRGIKAEGRKRGPPEYGLSLSFVHGYVLVHVSCSDCPIWKLIAIALRITFPMMCLDTSFVIVKMHQF